MLSYELKNKVLKQWEKIKKNYQVVINRLIPYKSIKQKIKLLIK